ncbi:MAG: winged helix-turn-helix domain-containing protein [Methylococcaceae bacterium]
MSDIVGKAAGEIWNYLDKNGATSVAKLTRETKIDEKNIQRGIGWLAQEGKLSIEIINRAETVSLI